MSTTKAILSQHSRAVELRAAINLLRAEHGDILNLWPKLAVLGYERLRRELNRIEASNRDRL